MKAIPLLGGGSMPMAGLGLCCRPTAAGDAVRQAVLDYLVMGGRHLDDATVYTNHREVGLGVRQALELGVPRSEIFLTTKIPGGELGFEAAVAWLARTLEELGLDYIDLVLLHEATARDSLECRTRGQSPQGCRQETWLALQRARGQGHIRHLGVSNFGPRQVKELQALGGAPVEVNQIEYHPWVPALNMATAAWCHGQGIVVTAYGSMGSSRMADQVTAQGALVEMGRQRGKTSGQILLRWAVQKNVTVIPGTSNPKHMAENLGIFDFDLTDEEMGMLDAIPTEQRMQHWGHVPDGAA